MDSSFIMAKHALQRAHVVQIGVRSQQGHKRDGLISMDPQQYVPNTRPSIYFQTPKEYGVGYKSLPLGKIFENDSVIPG